MILHKSNTGVRRDNQMSFYNIFVGYSFGYYKIVISACQDNIREQSAAAIDFLISPKTRVLSPLQIKPSAVSVAEPPAFFIQ